MGRGEGSVEWIFTATRVSAGWIFTQPEYPQGEFLPQPEYKIFTKMTQSEWLDMKISPKESGSKWKSNT